MHLPQWASPIEEGNVDMKNRLREGLTIDDLPKIDLHRHLEGAIRPATLWEVANRNGISLPANSFEELLPYVQYRSGDERTLKYFLQKFNTTRLILNDPDILSRVTYEALEDCKSSNSLYAEIRFNPTRMFMMGLSEEKVRDGMWQGILQARESLHMECALICGIARDLSMDMAERVTEFAIAEAGRTFVAMDLFGDESYSSDPFIPLLQRAKTAGLHITVHAGEAGGSENVKKAIEELSAERIGHGVRVMQDEAVVALAREQGTYFEMCPTSNIQTGAVEVLRLHPLRPLYQHGVKVGVHTDDPAVSNTTLNEEYRIAHEELDFSIEELVNMVLVGADHIFLDSYRTTLKKAIQKQVFLNE